MAKKGVAVFGITTLALIVGFLALRKRKGFTLKLTNAPEGAWKWYGSLGTPETSSGWLPIESSWAYPDDPMDSINLFISVIDENLTQILYVANLGPIKKGVNYTFDCEAHLLTGV